MIDSSPSKYDESSAIWSDFIGPALQPGTSPSLARKRHTTSQAFVEDVTFGPLQDGRLPSRPTVTADGLDIELYCVGGPDMIMWPVRVFDATLGLCRAFDARVRSGIEQLAVQYNVQARVALELLQSDAYRNNPYEAYVMLETQYSPGCESSWHVLADEAYSLIRESNIPGLKVMVFDPRAIFTIMTEIIPVHSSLLDDWEDLARLLVQEMDKTVKWTSINLFVLNGQYGGAPMAKRPTIYIEVSWDDTTDWSIQSKKLRAVMGTYHSYVEEDVALEVTRGSIVF